MKYCIDDKIIIELARMLQESLQFKDMSVVERTEHFKQINVMLERVKKKQYDLTSERRLL